MLMPYFPALARIEHQRHAQRSAAACHLQRRARRRSVRDQVPPTARGNPAVWVSRCFNVISRCRAQDRCPSRRNRSAPPAARLAQVDRSTGHRAAACPVRPIASRRPRLPLLWSSRQCGILSSVIAGPLPRRRAPNALVIGPRRGRGHRYSGHRPGIDPRPAARCRSSQRKPSRRSPDVAAAARDTRSAHQQTNLGQCDDISAGFPLSSSARHSLRRDRRNPRPRRPIQAGVERDPGVRGGLHQHDVGLLGQLHHKEDAAFWCPRLRPRCRIPARSLRPRVERHAFSVSESSSACSPKFCEKYSATTIAERAQRCAAAGDHQTRRPQSAIAYPGRRAGEQGLRRRRPGRRRCWSSDDRRWRGAAPNQVGVASSSKINTPYFRDREELTAAAPAA